MRVVDLHGSEPTIVLQRGGRRVWTMDSIAFASAEFDGDLIVTGSHGGASAGEYAASYGVALVACNDAGIGKNEAGTAGLAAIAAHGIAGVGVSHESARIGDGSDAWENGLISYVNVRASELGIKVGHPVKEQIVQLIERGGL